MKISFNRNTPEHALSKQQKIKNFQDQLMVERIAQERMMSPNERALLRLEEEERQRVINEQLREREDARTDSFFFGNSLLSNKSIFWTG